MGLTAGLNYRLLLTGTRTLSKGHQESQFLQPVEYCSISSRVITENSFSSSLLTLEGTRTKKDSLLLLLIKYKLKVYGKKQMIEWMENQRKAKRKQIKQ